MFIFLSQDFLFTHFQIVNNKCNFILFTCHFVYVCGYVTLLYLSPLAERNPPEGCVSSPLRLENTFWQCSSNLLELTNAFLLEEHHNTCECVSAAMLWHVDQCWNDNEWCNTGNNLKKNKEATSTLTSCSSHSHSTSQTMQLSYLKRIPSILT